jgi:multiple sugar transport system substrate-binding protein
MYDDAPQAISVIPGQSTDKSIGSKMTPMARPTVKKGGKPRGLVWSQPLVAFDDDPSTQKFMTYLSTNMKALKPMFLKGGQPPTTNEALKADWFVGDKFNNEFSKDIAATATKNPFWSFPTASSAQNAFDEQVEAALKGSVSPKAAMSAAKDALEALL